MRVEELIEKLKEFDRQDEVVIITPPLPEECGRDEELTWDVLGVDRDSDKSVALRAI